MTDALDPSAYPMPSELAAGDGARRHSVSCARSFAEIDEIAADWRGLGATPAADLAVYRAIAESAPGFVRPHVVVARAGDRCAALIAGRIERIAMPLKVGYRRLWQPRVRSLTFDRGAAVGDLGEEASLALLEGVFESLRNGEADVAMLHQLPIESPLLALARRVPPWACRDGCPVTNVRWILRLPESSKDPLAISGHTRGLARYYTKRLLRRYPDAVRFVTYTDPSDFERMVADVEAIASRTYQRALGVGFVADASSRQRLRRQMEHGTLRAFVLYCEDRPAAFWLGFRHGDVYFAESTGYDPEFSSHHVGKVLLAHKVEALRAEGGIRSVDFGFGDADYKHHWATDRLEEQTVAIFAPSVVGVGLNSMRTLARQADVWSRRVAQRLGVFDRIRSRERRRIASGTAPSDPAADAGDTTEAPDTKRDADAPASPSEAIANDRPVGGATLAALAVLMLSLLVIPLDGSGPNAVVVVVLALAAFESWLRGRRGGNST